MSWVDILKLDQINVGSTTLDTRKLPKEEKKDCCEEARIKFKSFMVGRATQGVTDDPKLYRRYFTRGIVDRLDCEEFKTYLRNAAWGDIGMESIFEEWEECENE
jgi:hypothetical protein